MLKTFTGQWLVLNFSNAGLWARMLSKKGEIINESKSKGYYDGDGLLTEGHRYIQVPTGTLYYKHISNMLHILLSERPVPSLYEEYSYAKRLDWIDDMAKGALVRVTTVPSCFDEAKKSQWLNNYIQETVTTRKCIGNCWENLKFELQVGSKPRVVSGAYPTWEVVIPYLGDDLFTELYTCLCKLHGSDICKIPFVEAMRLYGDTKVMHAFAETCLNNQRKAFSQLVTGYGSEKNYFPSFSVDTGSERLKRQRLVTRGIDNISNLRGGIVVPLLYDKALEKLKQGPGCATILDGGLVTIQEIMEMTPNTRLNYTEAYVR